MSPAAITFTVLGAVVVLLVSGRAPVGIVAVGAALVLYFTGIQDLHDTLAGFAEPTVILIASLFIVSEGLDASGVTAWLGQALVSHAGTSRVRLIVLLMALVALVTALISVNGSVAALLPVVAMVSVRLKRPVSQLLLPLVFGAHAGSLLALTGTPVSVIVSDAAMRYAGRPFGYFEFALIGVPLVVGSMVIVVYLGERLIPNRKARIIPADLSRHAHTLVEQYQLTDDPDALLNRKSGLAEIVIPPRSALVGHRAFPGMVSETGDLVIRAIQRQGEEAPAVKGETALAVGDSVLLQGPWAALDERLTDPDMLVVDAPLLMRRQAVPLGFRANYALCIVAALVVMLATGVVEPVIAGLLAACAMIQLRVVTVVRAYRSISWTTVTLVAGMWPVSRAMEHTGAAALIADALIGVVHSAGPIALLSGLFLITALLGQLISNMATALIVLPIGVTAAQALGISTLPVLMCINIAAAASFLTPVATPVNLIVMGPGGYRFGDYWRLGLPLLALFFVVAVFLVPLIWAL